MIFVEWLKQQQQRDDLVGDFARDVSADSDPNRPSSSNPDAWERYLSHKHITEPSSVLEAMRMATAEYRAL